jgi:L-iditol 2-dehydrogenase
MKAAVLYGKQDVRIEEVAPAALQPGEVRIRIEAALTCGTDLKVFKRGYHARMIVPPAVFGHELAGTISEVAPARVATQSRDVSQAAHKETAREWRIGDRVVVANSAPCGTCFHCGHDQENLCENLLFLNGAYAQSIIVPQRLVQKNLLLLKSETSFADAALVEPLACVVQGLGDLQLCANDRVLVLGAGPIGLMFVVLAGKMGCAVTVAGRHETRLRLARQLGAQRVIDIGDGNGLVTKIRQATSTHFDAIMEAVGQPLAWEAAVHLVRKGGTVNFFGGCPSGSTVTFDTTLIHYSNLRLLASFHHTPKTIRQALEHIESGVIRASTFVDGECPLTRLPELFHSMATGNRVVKTLIRVHQ